MAINRINDDIQSRRITQEGVNKATSGKKEETKKANADKTESSNIDKSVLSEDAKKLQQTEALLQNALKKLHQMDEVNHDNFQEIKAKIEENYYEDDEILKNVIDDIFSNQEINNIIEKRKNAEKYVSELKKLDEDIPLDHSKITKIKQQVNEGYYDRPEIIAKVANELFDLLDT